MSHVIVIIDEKLDCIGNTFPNLVNLAVSVKDKARELHAQHLAVVNQTEETEAWHTALEELQSQSTAMCDDASSFTEKQLQETLSDTEAVLDGYIN